VVFDFKKRQCPIYVSDQGYFQKNTYQLITKQLPLNADSTYFHYPVKETFI